MRAPCILVVAREIREREQIADVLLSAEQQVFCARDAREVLAFEQMGLTWAAVVFGGQSSAREASAYIRASEHPQATVLISTPPPDFVVPATHHQSSRDTLASLMVVIDKLAVAA